MILPRFLPRLSAVAWISLCASACVAQEHRELTVVDEIEFSLADGLKLERVADESLIKWPIVADFDRQGRLVVAESGGVGWPIQEHNEKKLHKIVRLVDSDGDGNYDQRIVAADQLSFPEGVLCLGDDILVAAPPVILRLSDADGDGVCEQRDVWFDGTTVTNCANDLHGPYLGRDGWIYWCKGAFGEQSHDLLDGRSVTSSAAQIYRSPPDGGGIESLVAGGMDNPVEVAMTPEGEKFFTSTFLQHPSGGLRDGIAHAIYGGVHGKDHKVIDGHARTGALMPIMTQLGPAAPSGLIHLESSDLVPEDATRPQRVLCAALFNLHKVTAHRLHPIGSTFVTDDTDLLRTDRVDFHPTDIVEDADGSLIVVDTGGWYDLCCPTSRVDQKTASGGLYRISRKTSDDDALVKGRAVDWESLTLDDAMQLRVDHRPWVRRGAETFIARSGQPALAQLQSELDDDSQTLDDRLAVLWLVSRIGSPEAVEIVARGLSDEHASIVQASCHAIGLHRDRRFFPEVTSLLQHASPAVQRAAAEALGRIGGPESIEPLMLAISRDSIDRHLEHSVLFALIEIGRRHPDADWPRSTTDHPARQRARFVILDQLGRAVELSPNELFVAARSEDPLLSAVARKLIARHPQWAGQSIDVIREMWDQVEGDADITDAISEIVTGWSQSDAVRELVGAWLVDASELNNTQRDLLAANLSRFSVRELPPSWSKPITTWLSAADPQTRTNIADSLSNLDLSSGDHEELKGEVIRLAAAADDPTARLSLLAAIPTGTRIRGTELERDAVNEFIERRDGNVNLAANALLRCRLSATECERLVAALDRLAPQQLMTAMEVVRRAGHPELDQRALKKLATMSAARSLPRGYLVSLYKSSNASIKDLASKTTAKLESAPEDIQLAVQKVLSELPEGDPTRGLQIFRGQRAACSACHRMGYIGQEIGPVLTKIGSSRTEESLLEAILYPSTRLEQSYQSTKVLLVDGTIHNGLIRAEDADSVELLLNAERKIKIAKDDIERMEPSAVSVMPQGMADVLTKQELADLMALLQAAK